MHLQKFSKRKVWQIKRLNEQKLFWRKDVVKSLTKLQKWNDRMALEVKQEKVDVLLLNFFSIISILWKYYAANILVF